MNEEMKQVAYIISMYGMPTPLRDCDVCGGEGKSPHRVLMARGAGPPRVARYPKRSETLLTFGARRGLILLSSATTAQRISCEEKRCSRCPPMSADDWDFIVLLVLVLWLSWHSYGGRR